MLATYKVVFDGASGVGKTCFLRRHRTGEFEKVHIPTPGVEITPLVFHTTRGLITFKIWDLGGSIGADMKDAYYQGAHGLISFYDVTRPATLETAFSIVRRRNLTPAVVYCGTHMDMLPANEGSTTKHRFSVVAGANGQTIPVHYISSKSNASLGTPFLALAILLTGFRDLAFVESPAAPPAEAQVRPAAPIPHTRTLEYDLGKDCCYDSLGEAVRDDLEDALVRASELGMSTTVKITVTHRKV